MGKFKGLRVFAPASVSNVACGFDILGFAIEEPGDEVVVRQTDQHEGLKIVSISGDPKRRLPREVHTNTASLSAQLLLDEINYDGLGIDMEIYKKVPVGTGIGSSAASAAAGVFGVNELLNRPFEKRNLLKFVIAAEKRVDNGTHGDHAAPSLMGGMVLVRDAELAEAHRMFIPFGLHAVVLIPKIEILSKDNRSILSDTVSLQDHIRQSANLAAMIIGFSRNDLDLVKKSMKDIIMEPQRAHLIPHFYKIQKIAYEQQALGCSISGAGPSIFALFPNSISAEKAAAKMRNIYIDQKIEHQVYVSAINNSGARIVS